ncbi:phosphonate ABC transporter ATP-binding protein [Streptomyces carpinensis]|uniref:Phosphonate ABC transporter ATP-binding protein n=1 Tax=Streptomyces carpinensis TaxID=66369 RepID=A0ABV1VUZ6_9ACTN|nr:phosphonate ABC transporter ATP-binding protein [Streptomyces carpinensis]
MTTTPVISLRHVSKSFGATQALDNVSLEVSAGQMVALLGLSGSGKSTLLRTINGLHRPTSGEIRVLGTDVAAARRSELRMLRRQVGFVFQQFELVGRLTALENVLSGALGRVRGPRLGTMSYPLALRKEALARLERVGLADRAFQRAGTLSGGQQQRVAIARAMMQQPQILLADEPVASLDPETSDQVMDLMFSICQEQNITVVVCLHQVDLAMKWAERIIGLREGKLVLDVESAAVDKTQVMDTYRRVLDEASEPDPATGGEAPRDAEPVSTYSSARQAI